MEKPLATNIADAEAVVKLAREKNKKLVLGYILRVHPSWVTFIELGKTLGKPLVTSDTAALREYFHRGTVYTKHDRRALAAAIAEALDNSDRLAADMRALRVELARSWARQRDALRRLLPLGERTHHDLLPFAMGH